MRLLALDTSSDRLSLALLSGERVWRRRLAARGRQEELLTRETEGLLRRARWKLKDLQAVVSASGPGSFTGIRIGMTFAGVLARTLDIPAVAVSLLEAEAVRGGSIDGARRHRWIIAVLPSRAGEFYFQRFRLEKNKVRPGGEPGWAREDEWPRAFRRACGGEPALLVGPAAQAAATLLKGGRARVQVWQGPPLAAADLVPPALERLRRGSLGDFSPLYLKPAYYERGFARSR